MEHSGFSENKVQSLQLLLLTEDLISREVQNVDRWLREVEGNLADKEAYLDLWVQGWFARVFAYNNFPTIMNPQGKGGPDLLIESNATQVYVEVRRFREDYDETKRLKDAVNKGKLVQYGNPEQDIRRVLNAIQSKSKQGKGIPISTAYVVAIYSHKESIEEIEFNLAVEELEKEAAQGGGQYSGIGAVLFYDRYMNQSTHQLWYLWENPYANKQRRVSEPIAKKLKSLKLPPLWKRPQE